MNKKTIPYHKTGYFSNLMLDYISGKETVQPFYNNPNTIDGYKRQLEEKQYSDNNRKVLVQSLTQQYQGFKLTDLVQKNIASLNHTNTYTVTTGHQLNLFTGPLYFIYKIVSTINLAKELKKNFPDKNFVPVFWMATEDHDFEEINHFNLFGKKHEISSTQTGAVGRMKLEGIDDVFSQLEESLNGRTGLESIVQKLKEYYPLDKTYAQAVKAMVNDLFGKYGLVIIDGDDVILKREFTPFIQSELSNRTNYTAINNTSEKLENLGFKKQVNPREINIFYLKDNLRERIVFEENSYQVLNTEIQFSKAQILEELKNHPERFSPNAVMRPLYQEVVLPNLAYIGGGGELAYWLQLKQLFVNNKVEFPVLVLRNSALIIDNGTQKKIDKLNLSLADIFKSEEDLIKTFVNAENKIEFDNETNQLTAIYTTIAEKVKLIDVSLEGTVKAELQKSLKSIDLIDKKLIRAIKNNEEVTINQLKAIKDKLFPNGSLQERKENFLYAYLLLGDNLIDQLIGVLNPLEQEFVVIN
jgi:bacillithiol biosynthesis cysteine-adding enzyme BshC